MEPPEKFSRPLGDRRYKKLFVLAVEGIKTEPLYFALFNSRDSVIRVQCLKDKSGSSPPQVLKRMEKHLKAGELKSTDEAWLVSDKDQWSDSQLSQLHQWSQKEENYGFALSNPKFEYWLLLHFADGSGVTSAQDCDRRLKGYIPDYDKSLDTKKITVEMINSAIERARQKDNPSCADWPRIFGATVYKLVESILNSGNTT